MTKCHVCREGMRTCSNPFATKKTLSGLNWLGQDVKVRTFKIAKWFINNIKNIDFIAFNQILKAIMI